MQLINKDIRKAKKFVPPSPSAMRFIKRQAHHKVRTALRAAIAHNDWLLAEDSTVGVSTVGFWDIA